MREHARCDDSFVFPRGLIQPGTAFFRLVGSTAEGFIALKSSILTQFSTERIFHGFGVRHLFVMRLASIRLTQVANPFLRR